MVFAKTSKAASRLSKQVQDHIFKKTYLAVVRNTNIDESGEYIDANDRDVLKQYIVVDQDIAVNTKLKFKYKVDNDGVESENMVESQNYEEITLKVRKLDDALIEQMPVLE